MPDVQQYNLDDLCYLMQRLRDPEAGCPWDLKQTETSIVPYTLEEVYELIEALEQGDHESAKGELGDVLFQVVFYAQLAQERALYGLDDIVNGIVTKLVRRHPHVFQDGTLRSSVVAREQIDEATVKARWEAIKQGERNARQQGSAMDDVPLSLPALSRAQKLQKRASQFGLDWPEVEPVLDVLRGEITEFEHALESGTARSVADELGDILFSVVNMARLLGLDAEQVLRQSNRKFESRVRHYEELGSERQLNLSFLSNEERDKLWDEAKHREGSQSPS